jgi:starch phosphorylase
MKFALNGALTIGTLDGANVEIRDAVGADNFFLFGLTAEEVSARKAGGYQPRHELELDDELLNVIELIASDAFSPRERGVFRPLIRQLCEQDPFLVLPDFRAYVDCQQKVGAAWHDVEGWTRASILNAARMGGFSSDRSIREYAQRIWKVEPVKVAAADRPPAPVRVVPAKR